MTPEQITPLDRAIELLGEFFENAVVVVQPDPRLPAIESRFHGSCLAASSLCTAAEMVFNGDDEDEEDAESTEDDDGDGWKRSQA